MEITVQSNTARACETTLPLTADETTHMAKIFKALGHPVRIQLLQFIREANGGLCACNIEQHFNLTQPTISHHIKILRDAGLIISESHGVWIHHRINPSIIAILQHWLGIL